MYPAKPPIYKELAQTKKNNYFMKDITPSLEILLNMANSHQNHVVGLNIPVVITRQGRG